MEYNPVASNIVATGSSDGSCRVWDVFSTKEIATMAVKEIQLQEMKWDFTGSLLCTGLKNREYRIWDSRTSSTVVTWEGHASPRRSYMAWLGDSYYLVTTGYSRRSNREVILHDIRNITTPVYTITADNSPGPFVPFYNPCCHVLWYAGRGDAKLNGIDVDDVSMWTNREGGNCILISLRSSVKSLAMLPQHLLDFNKNEVDKFLRINVDSGIDEMSISMPHQAGATIQEIYGKCPAPKPAVSSADWIRGVVTKPAFISKGSLRSDSDSEMKLLKPADIKQWLQDFRSKNLSSESVKQIQKQMQSLASTVQESSRTTLNTLQTQRESSSSRATTTSNRSLSSSTDMKDDRVTSKGITRRSSIFKAPDSYQTIIKGGGAVAQLEKSRTRLCLNLQAKGSQSKPSPSVTIPGSRPDSPSSLTQAQSRTSATISQPQARTSPTITQPIRVTSAVTQTPIRPTSVLPQSQPRTTPTVAQPQVRSSPSIPQPQIRRTADQLPSTTSDSTQIRTAPDHTPTLGELRRSYNQSPAPEVANRQGSSRSSVVLPRFSSMSGSDTEEIIKRLDSLEQRLQAVESMSKQLEKLTAAVEQLKYGSSRFSEDRSNDIDDMRQSLEVIRRRLGC